MNSRLRGVLNGELEHFYGKKEGIKMVELTQKRDELYSIKKRLMSLMDEVTSRREQIGGMLEEIGLQVSSIELQVNSIIQDTETEIDFQEKTQKVYNGI